MHPRDKESLARLLNRRDVPDDLADEYHLRLRMFHADGHSGPLGTLGLIDLARSLGYAPAELPSRRAPEVNWRLLPDDGSVAVEMLAGGSPGDAQNGGPQEWLPGVYLGIVQCGTLAVRLDGSRFVREARRDCVRLRATRETIPPDETPNVVSAALRAEELSPPPAEPEAAVAEEEAADEEDAAAGPVDVWVQLDHDIVGGQLLGYQGGQARVLLDNHVPGQPPQVKECLVPRELVEVR